ncbi:hypothetical protein TSTA_025470 [Talaromyces stipitatus ATCC 10500]|uniref:Uncharacterized protein n=1 Tax=Talaromyces stipitatus (strain ATCC 10500 / CBS 375.48 / QM 6759 / NRRL 1006) TaxID=441959 RepID=B8M4N5_TALSN|nr:uncharacterized protein TSTA_025470 [Talaromyces stipitatus ATCC 10500]EED19230.1 hypothetical protein TSTA_025470 [Talaromyces stipitatus ATCC 10500]
MRKQLESNFNGMFKVFFKSTPEQRDLRNRFEARMKQLIKDEQLQQKLIPPFEAGCRRINPDEGYLITLQKSNMQPIFESIKNICAHWVITSDGQEHPADILIAVTGRAGSLEATSDYFIRLLRKFLREQVKKFDVRLDAQTDFDKHTQAYMQNMVWTGTYRRSTLHYIQTLAENRWEDYAWEYHGNRYDYWEQGLSWIEEPLADSLGRDEAEALHSSTIPTKDSDISFYLRESSPLPSSLGVKDECLLEELAIEQVVETKLSEIIQPSVPTSIPV